MTSPLSGGRWHHGLEILVQALIKPLQQRSVVDAGFCELPEWLDVTTAVQDDIGTEDANVGQAVLLLPSMHAR